MAEEERPVPNLGAGNNLRWLHVGTTHGVSGMAEEIVLLMCNTAIKKPFC